MRIEEIAREKLREYHIQKMNELYSEVSPLASATESVADLAFSTNGPEMRDRMQQRMGDILKYAGQLMTKARAINEPMFPILLPVIETHCRQHSAFAAQASQFLATGTDAALLELRRYIKANPPELLRLPEYIEPNKRGKKPNPDFDKAVLNAVKGRTQREAMKSLRPLFPDRVGDPYNESDFEAFSKHVQRLKRAPKVKQLGGT